MESFTFNNVKSDSLDIIVKNMPLIGAAQRNIESIAVDGRNGNLHIDNGNYLSKSYTITCIAKSKNKIDDIVKTFVGKSKLTLSKYTDRFFYATVKNQIPFSKYLNYLQEFPIQFEVDPIAYSNEETTETLSASGTINVGGNADVSPILVVSGAGQLTVNGYPLNVTETGVTIDCELMNCIKNNLSANDKVLLDEFPKLTPGTNEITLGTGITNVIIKYRKGWL